MKAVETNYDQRLMDGRIQFEDGLNDAHFAALQGDGQNPLSNEIWNAATNWL